MTVTTTEESVIASAADQVTPAESVVAPQAGDAALVERDLLVEDVSIDGMCGVY